VVLRKNLYIRMLLICRAADCLTLIFLAQLTTAFLFIHLFSEIRINEVGFFS